MRGPRPSASNCGRSAGGVRRRRTGGARGSTPTICRRWRARRRRRSGWRSWPGRSWIAGSPKGSSRRPGSSSRPGCRPMPEGRPPNAWTTSWTPSPPGGRPGTRRRCWSWSRGARDERAAGADSGRRPLLGHPPPRSRARQGPLAPAPGAPGTTGRGRRRRRAGDRPGDREAPLDRHLI